MYDEEVEDENDVSSPEKIAEIKAKIKKDILREIAQRKEEADIEAGTPEEASRKKAIKNLSSKYNKEVYQEEDEDAEPMDRIKVERFQKGNLSADQAFSDEDVKKEELREKLKNRGY
jgi:hypothetical protein